MYKDKVIGELYTELKQLELEGFTAREIAKVLVDVDQGWAIQISSQIALFVTE